jgi:carbon-monoxide dehydrogenase medium subunit
MPTALTRFTIDRPDTLAEAACLLRDYGEAGRAYAGGTELLLAMKQAGLRYEHLVDLKTVPGLDRVELQNGRLRIGALATHRDLERHPLVLEHLPALANLESRVANPRVRASGTLGGNLCFAEPRSDPAVLLLCLDARVALVGPDGRRELSLDEFILGPYETALQPGELLEAVLIPLSPGRRAAYVKEQQRERPMLGLGLALEVSDGRVGSARLAVGSASPTPLRSAEAEALLAGPLPEARGRLPRAAETLADAAELLDDLDASAEYKRHLVGVHLERLWEQLT